ncbi:MAG: GntR family transcriptional regulator [Gemmatimonadota bacterium]
MSLDDRSGRIDRSRLEHLWAQVAADIRQEIESGRLAPGARLPNELELASAYGVARLTVRRAIADLIESGHVVVLRGRGTFVRSD